MTETKDSGDKTLRGGRKPLSLARTVESGHVRQNFSHGRSKSVVVEKRKTRKLNTPGAEAEKPAAPEHKPKPAVAKAKPKAPSPAKAAPGEAAKSLSEEEIETRARALAAARARAEEEQAAQPPPAPAEAKAPQETPAAESTPPAVEKSAEPAPVQPETVAAKQ
ncbi:MAG TPA: translation initiation factor IF-2 associated domain-containing protein, partial [Hyphomicrobiaceae bacterium]|nr:translation initiation factor IF-2 associated domain-containing protein [Hyphomicrobiaceae bacterium]